MGATVSRDDRFPARKHGLAHGYQGGRLILVIVLYGWLFGAFVAWRKSLLSAMLAHGLQDSLGGILFFASTK